MSHQVFIAEPYRPHAMGSLGDASGMLICQYQFPLDYDVRDKIMHADSDRCFQWDYDHARRCFLTYTGTGEVAFESWVKGQHHDKVFAFLKDILKADPNVEWTGYRILGSVHRGNGFPVWSLQLFAKHPDSRTQVYSGSNAPNVKRMIRRLSNGQIVEDDGWGGEFE